MNRQSPKYTLLKNRSNMVQKFSKSNPKTSLRALQLLESEVQKSKIAVENITSFGATESNFKQKIDVIQNELQDCITSINVQTKRNRVLNELIALLKGQMFKYQANQKKKQEAESIKMQKMIKKIEYEIDQIYQKHNQQIAKIHQLKDLASSRRSERVVYSNLFKKLERQIKHYEQMYREQLIKGQTIQSKKNELALQRRHLKKNSQEEQDGEIDPIIDQNTFFGSHLNGNSSENSRSAFNTDKQGCNSLAVYAKPDEVKKKKVETQFKHQEYKINTVIKQEKARPLKQIRKRITQYTNNVDKIKTITQCLSVQEIIAHFSKLKEENEDISSKIIEQDSQIEQINEQNENLRKKIGTIKFDRNYKQTEVQQIQKPAQEQQKGQIQNYQKHETATLLKCFTQIMQICGFTPQNQVQSQSMIRNGVLKEVDEITTELIENRHEQLCNKKKKNRVDSDNSDLLVDTILDKMEKFSNCQRIMDRKSLQQQYFKELSKKKNSFIGKNRK